MVHGSKQMSMKYIPEGKKYRVYKMQKKLGLEVRISLWNILDNFKDHYVL